MYNKNSFGLPNTRITSKILETKIFGFKTEILPHRNSVTIIEYWKKREPTNVSVTVDYCLFLDWV